jgi:hypothetical protein
MKCTCIYKYNLYINYISIVEDDEDDEDEEEEDANVNVNGLKGVVHKPKAVKGLSSEVFICTFMYMYLYINVPLCITHM